MKRTTTISLLSSRSRVALLTSASLLLLCSTSLPAALGRQSPQKKKPSTEPPQKIEPQFREAQALLQQGRFDEARQQVQAELAKNPTSIEGFNLLGIICVSEKDYGAALEAFQRALKLAPSSARTKVNLGNLYVA